MFKIINAQDPLLEKFLARRIFNWEKEKIQVKEIISAVRQERDEALCRFTLQFDGVELSPKDLPVTEEEKELAWEKVEDDLKEALRQAKDNIAAFHRKQLQNSWFDCNLNGVILGQMVRPLRRVGIYVPGGTAVYPSSVLMNAIPAQVAGVKEIVMVTPPDTNGRVNPYILVAAMEAGVTEIYKVGGAQAIAALAYGTQTIKPVDKITGPGNIYVTLAKQQVYGQVDIDMLAGPSEVVVIADDSANPVYIAADLLSQAEHDPMSSVFLLTPEENLARGVVREIEKQLESLPRKEIAARSLADNGAAIITQDLKEAVDLANNFAPEHLELLVAEPFYWLSYINSAGAIFLGPYSPEPVGDYIAGPNHILPTGGAARFSSPLGVEAFVKKSSVIAYSRQALEEVGPQVIKLARLEGLDAHANAIKVRLGGTRKNEPEF